MIRSAILCFASFVFLTASGGMPSVSAQEATPIDRMKIAEGFTVERLYSVPKAEQGSWVNMCVDPKGRLIVSDQYGKLYRIELPRVGETGEIKPEPLDLPIGQAQGLLHAFDSLYVMVANNAYQGPGLYRVRDTNGDDTYDEVKQLRKLSTGGEHGPHAIVLSPDGKGLYIIAGNKTPLTKVDTSRVPRVWDEDLILPRAYGRGFMKGTPAPGGWIARTDPDGAEWELLSTGYRNQYDAAFNQYGDLFTYDADMEWDVNTPWYRPTRVCLAASGSEFGWRNGSGKWPEYYPDSLPPVLNIGPGSPTGVTFGYDAKFPEKYRDAFFICDWSYGKLYAVHMKPDGAGYSGTAEEFITGTPLPLTDIIVHPGQGAMYFTTGGRRVQSGLYRVTYTGSESTADEPEPEVTEAIALRHKLESLHRPNADNAVELAWPHLGSTDRYLQTAARVALEHQDPKTWQDKVFAEKDARTRTVGLIALCRVGEKSPELQGKILETLNATDWESLTHSTKIALVRCYQLAFTRFGEADKATNEAVAERLQDVYPAPSYPLNVELTQLLVYLQSPATAKKAVNLLIEAPTQEAQINYAKSLRLLETGWTPELRDRYFEWFVRAQTYRGGASFGKFVEYIKKDAIERLPADEKSRLEPLILKKAEGTTPNFTQTNRKLVKKYTVDELLPAIEEGLAEGGRDFRKGRRLFGEASCFACHRFNQEGGAVGPDLTALAGRFNPKDLLESTILPSKEISDQYGAITILTEGGRVVTGRIVNLSNDTYRINENMLDPNQMTSVKMSEIEEMMPSKTSMMPEGLLDRFTEDEILDLMAYLLSRGNPDDAMFDRKKSAAVGSE